MITNLIFDLDNTLYSSKNRINHAISERMHLFIQNLLGVSFEEAAEIRKQNLKIYGTTLEWLQKAHNLKNPEIFFNYIHPESETEEIVFDSNIRPFLKSINMPKTVLTNAPYEHAERVLKFLKIDDLFDFIVDLKDNNYIGKPDKNAYYNVLKKMNSSAENTLFIDDYMNYVNGYIKIGGKAVLVDENNNYPDYKELKIKTIYDLDNILTRF